MTYSGSLPTTSCGAWCVSSRSEQRWEYVLDSCPRTEEVVVSKEQPRTYTCSPEEQMVRESAGEPQKKVQAIAATVRPDEVNRAICELHKIF